MIQILTNEGAFGHMFSRVEKPGFIKVSNEEKAAMPFITRKEVNYVNPDYKEQLLGRDEIRWTSDESNKFLRFTEVIAKDLVSTVKQSIVLKNIASYKSAIIVNHLTNFLIDGNVFRGAKNAKVAGELYYSFTKAQDRYLDLKVSNKDFKQFEEKLMELHGNIGKNKELKELKESNVELYEAIRDYKNHELSKYLDLGLSINTLDGVRSKSSLLSEVTGKALGDTHMGNTIGNVFMLNQNTKVGKASKYAFSFIDFQGRYMAIKSLEAQGLDTRTAVRRANDLFGQMDEMAPALVQMLDDKGLFIFAKWFSSVAPAIMKASKNNPGKALAMTVSLYIYSYQSDTMTSNVSPVEGIASMAEGAVTGDSIVWKDDIATKWIPKVYMEMAKEYKSPETHNFLFKGREKKYNEDFDNRSMHMQALDYLFDKDK